MRCPIAFVALLLALTLAACGGGGGALPAQGEADLSGAVTQIDGSALGTGGIELLLVETGERVVTAPDGSFAFRHAPTGSLTLKLAAAPGSTSATLGEQAYATNCSACHGADGSGGINARNTTRAAFDAALGRTPMFSISLTAAEADAVYTFLQDAPAPAPDPTPEPTPTPPPSGTDGATLYQSLCASCHGDFDSPANAAGGNRRVLGARACVIEGSLAGTSVFPGGVPAMTSLQGLTSAQVAAIAEYLNSELVSGAERYEANCAGCHGADGSGGRSHEGVRGEDAWETAEAILEEPAMRYLECLPSSDLAAIGSYLQGLAPGGDDDDDASDEGGEHGHGGDDPDDEDDGGHDDEDGRGGGDRHEADVDDGDEMGEVEVQVHRVRDGEHLHVRLRIRDGRLERSDVSRSEHDEREAEVAMMRTAANDDADMKGKIEVEVRDDRQRFEVEVEHATPGRDLEAVVIAPDGAEDTLGTLTVDANGEAGWEINTSDGGLLPFGAADVTNLEGYQVVVRDAIGGTDLLTGLVPAVPAGVSTGSAGGG